MKTKKLIFLSFLLSFVLNLAAQDEKFVMPKLFVGVNYEPYKFEIFEANPPQTLFLFGSQPFRHLRVEPFFGYKYNIDADGYGNEGYLFGMGVYAMAQHKSLNFSAGLKLDQTNISIKYRILSQPLPIIETKGEKQIDMSSFSFVVGMEYFPTNQFSLATEIGLKDMIGSISYVSGTTFDERVVTFISLKMRYHFLIKK